MSPSYPSLRAVLDKIHESFRPAILRRIGRLLQPRFEVEIPPEVNEESLTKMFEVLGKATYRLEAIKDLRKIIAEARGYSFIYGSFKELEALREICARQVELAHQYITSYIVNEGKNKVSVDDTVFTPGPT